MGVGPGSTAIISSLLYYIIVTRAVSDCTRGRRFIVIVRLPSFPTRSFRSPTTSRTRTGRNPRPAIGQENTPPVFPRRRDTVFTLSPAFRSTVCLYSHDPARLSRYGTAAGFVAWHSAKGASRNRASGLKPPPPKRV